MDSCFRRNDIRAYFLLGGRGLIVVGGVFEGFVGYYGHEDNEGYTEDFSG